jgi:L-malate glycosyltransferase
LKILHTVERYHPHVGGMEEVVRQLSEKLVLLGHDVTVATGEHPERKNSTINDVKVVSFNIKGNLALGMHGETEAYKNFLLSSNFDIIVNFAAQQWATDIALPILSILKGKKIFVPTGFSGLYDPAYASYFENMKTWMTQYQACVFPSSDYRDINFARENNIQQKYIIPNGAGADEFMPQSNIDVRQQLHIPSTDFLILHVGSNTGLKGQKDAIEIFLRSKVKNATLLLIGHNNDVIRENLWKNKRLSLLRLKNIFSGKKIILTSVSRQQTVAAYKTADLFLFPSNIECSPIVLFECMAAGLPFISTDVGNVREIIEWTQAGKLLPTMKDEKGYSHADTVAAANMLEQLYQDPQERDILGKNGFDSWKKRFTWEAITKEYENLYHNLLKHDSR